MTKRKRKPTTKWTTIEGRFNLAGVQWSDYQLVCGTPKPGSVLRLIGEPYNKYDRLAIRVEYQGVKLGYIPQGSIHQSELWRAYRQGCKCIGVLTAFNKNNPTWCMITMMVKRTNNNKVEKEQDIKL